MKRLLIAASFFASFSCMSSDNIGIDYSNKLIDWMNSLPRAESKKVAKKPDLTNAPVYVKDFYEMSLKQKKVIAKTIKVGNNYQTSDYTDKRLGYHLAAISWIESRACENTGKNKKNHHAYGCFQVHYTTAKNRSKISSKRVLVEHLETFKGGSDYALQELDYWISYHKGDMKKVIASYNAGFKYSSKEAKTYASMVLYTAKLIEKHF